MRQADWGILWTKVLVGRRPLNEKRLPGNVGCSGGTCDANGHRKKFMYCTDVQKLQQFGSRLNDANGHTVNTSEVNDDQMEKIVAFQKGAFKSE